MSPRAHASGGGFGRRRVALLAAALAAVATVALPAPAAAADSVVAQAKAGVRVVPVYRAPGAAKPFLRLGNPNRHGVPRVFLVKERRAGWERVYLPLRPNGVTGWIRDEHVELALNPYRISVSLGTKSLTVYRGSRVVHRERAGVGRSVVPTPRGTYYLVELLRQPNPNGVYGPYAFGTSAFSNVLYRFGSGPGQIGLHGTNAPWSLGANASHGCIRISNAGITKLARLLPLGTPIRISA